MVAGALPSFDGDRLLAELAGRIDRDQAVLICRGLALQVHAGVDDVVGHQLLDADHQDVLVVGAIEHTEIAAAGEFLLDPPKVVMLLFLFGRDAEGRVLSPKEIPCSETPLPGSQNTPSQTPTQAPVAPRDTGN